MTDDGPREPNAQENDLPVGGLPVHDIRFMSGHDQATGESYFVVVLQAGPLACSFVFTKPYADVLAKAASRFMGTDLEVVRGDRANRFQRRHGRPR